MIGTETGGNVSAVGAPIGSLFSVPGAPLDLLVDPHGNPHVVFEVGPPTSVAVMPLGTFPPGHMRRYIRAAMGPFGPMALWSS